MSALILKLIAAAAMLTDHIGAAFFFNEGPYPWFYTRHIGRVAFPIFAFLIANGCVHTKNIKLYLLRLGLFALVSEVFYDLAFGYPIDFLWRTNIFYTLFLGTAAIAVYKHIKSVINDAWLTRLCVAVVPLPFIGLAEFFYTDFASGGVMLIYVFYLLGTEKRTQCAAATVAGMLWFYVIQFEFTSVLFPSMFLASLFAVPLIALYNGKPGPTHPALKWGFYAFYPAHLAVLAVLS